MKAAGLQSPACMAVRTNKALSAQIVPNWGVSTERDASAGFQAEVYNLAPRSLFLRLAPGFGGGAERAQSAEQPRLKFGDRLKVSFQAFVLEGEVALVSEQPEGALVVFDAQKFPPELLSSVAVLERDKLHSVSGIENESTHPRGLDLTGRAGLPSEEESPKLRATTESSRLEPLAEVSDFGEEITEHGLTPKI